MFDTILVVTDGTDTESSPAEFDSESHPVERAVELAATHGADLHALYVVDVAKHWDMAVERREAEGEAAVDAIADRAAERGVEATRHFRYGSRHEEIVDYAEAHDVDLIVVPSTTRSGLSRMLHPNDLAERVMRRTAIPVLGVDAGDVATDSAVGTGESQPTAD